MVSPNILVLTLLARRSARDDKERPEYHLRDRLPTQVRPRISCSRVPPEVYVPPQMHPPQMPENFARMHETM